MIVYIKIQTSFCKLLYFTSSANNQYSIFHLIYYMTIPWLIHILYLLKLSLKQMKHPNLLTRQIAFATTSTHYKESMIVYKHLIIKQITRSIVISITTNLNPFSFFFIEVYCHFHYLILLIEGIYVILYCVFYEFNFFMFYAGFHFDVAKRS